MTDVSFLFLMLPLALMICAFLCLIMPALQKYVLIVFSLVFYACGSPRYMCLFVMLMLISVALAYVIGAFAGKGRKRAALPFLVCGILLNVSLLFYYKYYDFSAQTVNRVLGTNIGLKNLLLPLGISFFAFKAISLLVDVYRGTVVLKKDPTYAVLYLCFFGQVISGPITRYNEFYENYELVKERKSIVKRYTDGAYHFMRGYCKKILIANILSAMASSVFGTDLSRSSAGLLWLGSIAYSLQLYYDFSGYSDMAIGVGNMFGIHSKENFNYPYCTKTVSEFWRRWHMSLGSWFRDYIYFPLGGSRVNSRARLYFNLLAVWILTGIWHGASMNFIVWGLGYFVVIALEKTFEVQSRIKGAVAETIYRILCLIFINFEWVLFNSPGVTSGLRYIKHMLIGSGNELAAGRCVVLLQEYGIVLAAAVLFAIPVIPKLKEYLYQKNKTAYAIANIVLAGALAALFAAAISFVMAGQNNPFLYGNF